MLTYKLAMTKYFKVVTERMSGMPAAFSEEQQESIREELFQAGIRLSKSDGMQGIYDNLRAHRFSERVYEQRVWSDTGGCDVVKDAYDREKAD